MKHFYSQIKNFLNIALFLGIFLQSYLASSQTTLSVGDIVFTGYDATATPTPSTSDSYSFVLLVPISANTVISFTDRGYNGSVWTNTGGTESTVTWTSATAIPLGTEILISGLTASTYNPTTLALTQNGVVTVTEGTPTNGLSLSTVGDQITAFQGGSGSITGGGVSIKGALSYSTCDPLTTTAATWDIPSASCTIGPSTSAMPPGLANGTSAFYTGTLPSGGVPQSGKFTGAGPFANAAAIKTAVMNPANWSFSATTQTMPSGAPFVGIPPAITMHQPNRTICVGATTTLPITATNATGYQWQVDTGSGFANLSNGAPYSGVTTATLTITNATAAMNGYLYRCTVSGVGSVNSNSSTLTVPNIVVSTTSITHVTCNGGNNGSVTVSSTGGFSPYSYSWSPSGITSATASGLTAGTYTVTATDNIGCTKDYSVTINEPTLAVSSPSITTQPSTYSACVGSTATFSVIATNTATYQWQVNTGSGFTNITNGGTSPNYSGANTANLSIGSVTSAMNGYLYKVILTSSCLNTLASNGTAVLNVNSLPVATATPSSQTICSGNSTNIALTSVPTGATFAWTIATTSGTVTGASAGSGTSIAQTLTGNGTINYTVTPTINSCPGTPITVTITVNPLPTATATPAAPIICSGSSTNIALTSTPTGATFAWTVIMTGSVSGASAGSGTTIAQSLTGVGTANYTVTPTINGCPGPPIIIPVTVNPLPVATATPASKTICSGTSPNIALTSTPTGAAFAWTAALTSGTVTGFSASSGTSLNQTLSGDGVVTYTVTPTLNGCPGTSITIPITVLGLTSITSHPSASGVCVGSNTTFSTIASNATSYQWQENSGAGYSNISDNALYSGTTSATLTITGATATMNGYSYRVIASGTCAPAATSNNATLTVYNIIATPTQVNVSCNGGNNGSATVTPVGGSGTYTYLWNNGATTATISNLTQGNYSVTITDSFSCSVTQAFTITEPPVLVASADTFTNPSCNTGANGSATVAVSGGTLPYTYSWSPSGGTGSTASGLADGTYTVTVTDAKGCITTQSFTLVQPSALAVTTSQTDILCNGDATGSASVIVTGGTPGYTYSWSPSGGNAATASNLIAGTYTVTITDNNSCFTTRTFIITEPITPLTASQGTIVNVNCFGDATGSATVNVTGGTGSYSYSWSPSGGTGATASALAAGAYTVTVTDGNGCSTTQGFNISQPASALSATTASVGVSCFGGANGSASVTVSGGTPNYSYSWSPSGGTASSANGLSAGNYICTITDSKGCILIQPVTVDTPTPLSLTTTKVDVSCNGGTNGSATVTASGGTGAYTYSWAPTGGNAATASGLPQGTYTVTVTDANSCFITQSVTIDQPASLTLSLTKTDVLCNGGATGTATAIPSGGNGSYTYAWSPSGGTASTATGLAIGTYTCTVTDAKGCFETQSITIGEPAILSATTSQMDATCSSTGQATVTVSGGATPYSYAWSSGQTSATATGLTAGSYSCVITDANGCTLTKNFFINTTNTLVAVTSQTDVLCNGANTGSASVVPSGAPGPFSYVWAPSGGNSDTASNLTAGNYSVTITSANGCSIIKNFTITEPSALAVTPSQVDLLCHGGTTGSASVVVTGGTGSYTYAWAPSGGTADTATGLTAGTYVVTINDGNLCQTTQSFTITEPNAFVATITPTNVSCNGGTNGSATVTATGGTGAYTYSWAPTGGTAATASGLSAGSYTVTVTDANSCTTTQSVTINEPSALVASIGGQTDVTCNGLNNGSATVNATGGTGTYTYSWFPSGGTAATATGLSPGTYIATVTDANNCSATQSFTITEPTVLTASATGQTDNSCHGGSTGTATVTAAGGTGTYTYLWAPSGGTADTATGLSAGTYTVTVTDANSCTATQSFTITEPNVITATITPTNVNCHGEATGSATVTATGGTGTYTYSWAPSGGTAATATGLSAGTYSVTITDANSCTTTQNVTINEPSLISASITTQTNVTCNGASNGSATVTATGGTGAYTYVWSPTGGNAATATGLNIGIYTVTVTDANGCSTTQSVTISEPSVLTATTTQTNVTCIGATDGSATVTATGGTGTYTYTWSPSGGNAATATGLSAGNYTVTITDAKGCTLTKSISILTIPDVTAPVPNLATLPVITANCSITATQIPVPTATDNCAGIINATTTDPLNYTAVGTYGITWNYNDGHGNTSTQNQTVKVIASPLDLVTFINTEFTYSGSINTIQVGNLPAGATVTYAITPATGTANGATNAGNYSVTATVTPSASMPNCSPVTLTAQLTIKKAVQQITFAALPVKILGGTNTFNLAAIANSGLAIRYSFTSPTALPAANVSATTGVVNLLRPGSILITAHQDGNTNYLPAPDVSQLLIVKNNDITIAKITIGNQVFLTPAKNANIKYVMVCDENNPSVSILNETNAIITPSANFNISTPKPGIYTQNITVTSEDGSVSNTYTITVEKPFGFFDIVRQKFNNVLLVNNNPLTNGGYEFVSYEWFKNGQPIGTGQYYTAGNALGTTLDPTADYSVKMTTKDGKVLQTCKSKISLSKTAEAKLYPNPIQTGKTITVEADFPVEELANMQISLYSVSGQLIKTVKSSSIQTEIQLPQAETSMYIVVVETGNIKKTLKVIVNK